MIPLYIAAAEPLRIARTKSKFLGRSLIAGDNDHGYYGVIPGSEIITGSALATLVGLTRGTVLNVDPGWLAFALNGKKLLVAKKPLRYSLSYSDLASKALIDGRQVTIQGKVYKVRVPFGANRNPVPYTVALDHPDTHGSEWNRLMYHVCATGTLTSEGISVGDFAQFPNTELGIGAANGRDTICREIRDGYPSDYITRGINEVGRMNTYPQGTSSNYLGWRPVLELVG